MLQEPDHRQDFEAAVMKMQDKIKFPGFNYSTPAPQEREPVRLTAGQPPGDNTKIRISDVQPDALCVADSMLYPMDPAKHPTPTTSTLGFLSFTTGAAKKTEAGFLNAFFRAGPAEQFALPPHPSKSRPGWRVLCYVKMGRGKDFKFMPMLISDEEAGTSALGPPVEAPPSTATQGISVAANFMSPNLIEVRRTGNTTAKQHYTTAKQHSRYTTAQPDSPPSSTPVIRNKDY
jgi:hypothetical protein